jgi:thioredoxin 1
MKIKELKDHESFDSVLESVRDTLIVVDFFATWCGPCKRLSPQLVSLQEKYPNVHFYKINVDENNTVSKIYKVSAMPTILFIKNKKTVKTVVGADIKEITNAIQKYA